MTFGEKIKEARLAMNLSQTELAQMTGISERSLYTYEQLGTLPEKQHQKACYCVNMSYPIFWMIWKLMRLTSGNYIR
ncbi:MAG: helix-turn-helix domain-containing protein [Faecalimonas umbilicata]